MSRDFTHEEERRWYIVKQELDEMLEKVVLRGQAIENRLADEGRPLPVHEGILIGLEMAADILLKRAHEVEDLGEQARTRGKDGDE